MPNQPEPVQDVGVGFFVQRDAGCLRVRRRVITGRPSVSTVIGRLRPLTEQVGALAAQLGDLDVLVNAAGGLPEPASGDPSTLEAQLAQ